MKTMARSEPRARYTEVLDQALSGREGIGKPEQFRYGAPGAWSRRVTEEHRLVYLVDGDDLIILQVRYHY